MLMKTILSGVIISLLISVSVQAQNFWYWSDPVALTDSLSDNQNPYLFYNGIFHMVWEKNIDSVSTSIWYRDITTKTPPVEILSSQGVHYKHPKIMNTQNSLFYVFYETNENGNTDIYYIEYQGDTNFSEPIPFATTAEEDKEVEIDYHNWYWDAKNSLVWIQNSSVYHSYLNDDYFFTNPVLIDSGNCSNPIITRGGNHIIWEKETPFGKHLMISRDVSQGGWGAPEVLYDQLMCQNLKSDKVADHMITWSVLDDTTWKIAAGISEYQGLYYEVFDITSDTPLTPGITFYFTPLEPGVFNIEEMYLVFPYDTSGYAELYMNEESWYYNQFSNFTNWQTESRNPDFFFGPDDESYCDGIYLVWESFKNEHWQIFYSEAPQCWGNINEFKTSDSFISTHPNPFTHETTLKFTLDTRRDVVIEVYNNRGRQITTIASQSFNQGEHQLRWDGGGVAAGIYIIKMTVGDMVYTSKVVKSP